jgi:hypothetical protein
LRAPERTGGVGRAMDRRLQVREVEAHETDRIVASVTARRVPLLLAFIPCSGETSPKFAG